TQLTGLPGWAQDQAFSVVARPSEGFPLLPPNENREQVRAMVREMLESRFHLNVHTQSREERVLKLEAPTGGREIKAVDPPSAARKGRFRQRRGRGFGRSNDRKKGDHGRHGVCPDGDFDTAGAR